MNVWHKVFTSLQSNEDLPASPFLRFALKHQNVEFPLRSYSLPGKPVTGEGLVKREDFGAWPPWGFVSDGPVRMLWVH